VRALIEIKPEMLSVNALLAFCMTLLACSISPAECVPPHYREAQVWEKSKTTVLMAVSMQLRDFAPSRLVCLAAAFKQKYPGRSDISIMIFSSHEVAKRYTVGRGDYGPVKGAKQRQLQSYVYWIRQLHAIYVYDNEKREEYIEIKSLGSDFDSPYDTRIDLPSVESPHCRLEMDGRCLLAIEEILYPADLLKAGVSGTVTLTGTILRNGKIADVKVNDGVVKPGEPRYKLVDEAMKILNSWRFEEAKRQSAFQLSFVYQFDPSLPERGWSTATFALPNQVTISGRTYK
jgi:hypothetical protein